MRADHTDHSCPHHPSPSRPRIRVTAGTAGLGLLSGMCRRIGEGLADTLHNMWH